jgi:hypothetical protein
LAASLEEMSFLTSTLQISVVHQALKGPFYEGKHRQNDESKSGFNDAHLVEIDWTRAMP